MVFIFAQKRHGQIFAFIIRAAMHRAMQRFHPFRMRNRRGQDGRQIIRHLAATHRDLRGMHQMAFAEDREACGAAAHINYRGAKLLFIFHQRREP